MYAFIGIIQTNFVPYSIERCTADAENCSVANYDCMQCNDDR